jgi:hypothetical protein
MVVGPESSGLKEINALVNKINGLGQEMEGAHYYEKDLLVQHISGVFCRPGEQPNEDLFVIELLLGALNADLAVYRNKAEKLRSEFQEFQKLRKLSIPF